MNEIKYLKANLFIINTLIIMTFNLTEVLLKPDDDLETCKSKFNLLLADHRHRCNIIYHYQKKVSFIFIL